MRATTVKLSLLALFWAGLSYSAPATTLGFYSEQAYLQREELFSTDLRFRYEAPLASWLRPFLQAGAEDIQPSAYTSLANRNGFAYAMPGLRLSGPGSISLFVGPRIRGAYAGPAIQTWDWRSLLVIGAFREKPLGPRWRLFGELYSETVFTSADENNLLQAAYARGGLRHQWGTGIFLDFFLEPYVTLSLRDRPNQERVDLRASTRLGGQLAGIQLAASVSYLATAPLSEKSPYPANGVRALLVMGGEW